MQHNFRPPVATDFSLCRDMLWEGDAYPAAMRERLPDLWRQLYREGRMVFTVFEDMARIGNERVRGFGSTVFIGDAFADELMAARKPGVCLRVYEDLLSGDSLVLGPQAVALANAGAGLNLLMLDVAIFTRDLGHPEARPLLALSAEAFAYEHKGFNIRSLQREVFGADIAGFMHAGGATIVSDYRDVLDGIDTLPASHHPFMLSVRRDTVGRTDGSLVSNLFVWQPPRFGFSRAEQKMLLLALRGADDHRLAEQSNLSHETIKKRWNTVHAKARAANPDWFGETTGATRGVEKRRTLLDYLRNHKEELRPYAPLAAKPR